MSEIAILVEGLGKQYRIGASPHRYNALRDKVADAALKPFRVMKSVMNRGGSRGAEDAETLIWALKDVSFEIKRGEVVGVIGRNGAGKSTLLKLLSRITEPTTGRAEIHGRVGSLLEVGTGFHPELTGRENILLNGAILGMLKREIERKFDDIVAFAEVDKFIDTPVKHYSSGMHMRLAFAVAAHLEPEILLVDEVLAVGDAAFQKKCMGKMGEVSKQGRTVVFVSHNMTAMQSLCQRAIWLLDGQVSADGNSHTVVRGYLQAISQTATDRVWKRPESAPGDDRVRLHRARVLVPDPREITVETPFKLEFTFWNFTAGASLNLSVVLFNTEGACVFNTVSPAMPTPAGLIRATCQVPSPLLNDGSYRVRILIVRDTSVILFDDSEVLLFEVHDVPRNMNWYGKWVGVVRPALEWEMETVELAETAPVSLATSNDGKNSVL